MPPWTPPSTAASRTPGRPATRPSGSSSSEGVYDDFLDKFTKKVLEKAEGLAPLSSVAAAERLDDQVKQAVDDGATLVSEGERKGAFFPPGVLTNVSPDSPSYSEELFGPVATVYKVGSEDEAVRAGQ